MLEGLVEVEEEDTTREKSHVFIPLNFVVVFFLYYLNV